MADKKLEVGFNPPEEEEAEDEKFEMILDIIKEKGCSYPAEISGELNVSKDTVYRKLRFMEKKGRVKRMVIKSPDYVPEWLKPRITELWNRKIKGDAIRRISWYAIGDESK